MKNIIKRIIVGVAITLIVGFLTACEVKAETIRLNNVTLTSSNFHTINPSNANIYILDTPLYSNAVESESNFILTLCADNNKITSWYANGSVTSLNFMTTSYSCTFPNSTYSGGHVLYIYGSYTYDCGVGAGVCYLNPSPILTFYAPNQSSYALLSYSVSNNPFEIDYATQNVINAQQQMNNNLSQIIGQNQNIYNMQNQNLTNINNSQKETNDLLKDGSAPPSSDYDFSGYNASNGVISDLITMPISLVQSFLNGFNTTCSPFVLGDLLGTNLTLPCINPGEHLGVVWNMIDIIISGLYIYVFGKSCVKKFNDITNLKENQIDEVFN